ncbi:VOC family protein [Aquisediminimonas profunda]|uniref:VOC family protein n=1 Tax=Aquisediminimonas profunda TaxID=1550733 RepID=UPI001C63AF2C|nr:VOC family protein [Aquisediminimonas profunda]
MILGVHHIGVTVRSIEAMLPLYETAAGLSRIDIGRARPALAEDHSHGAFESCMLAAPNAYVQLLQKGASARKISEPSPINRPGIRHFCIQNHDCAKLERAVYHSGGTLIAPPLDLGTGNQYAYARDREDNIIEIEGLPYAPAAQPTWIGHVAIVTENMDASLAFFSELLRVPTNGRKMIGPTSQIDRMGGLSNARLEGAWLQASNMLLEFWQFHAPPYEGPVCRADPSEPGYSHIAFETDDLEGETARLLALGCTAAEGLDEVPSLRSDFLKTRSGIMIQLVEPRDPVVSLAALSDLGVCARLEAGK